MAFIAEILSSWRFFPAPGRRTLWSSVAAHRGGQGFSKVATRTETSLKWRWNAELPAAEAGSASVRFRSC